MHNYSLDSLQKQEPDQTGKLGQEFKITATGHDDELDLFQAKLLKVIEDLADEFGVKIEVRI